jgi:hypothetical protein
MLLIMLGTLGTHVLIFQKCSNHALAIGQYLFNRAPSLIEKT